MRNRFYASFRKAHPLVKAKGQKLISTPKQNKKCHVLTKISQIGMIPHNMTLLYPRKKVGGVYRNHPACPSVCLSVRLSVQSKLNLDHNFWTKSDRALILHKCISCDKTFLSIPKCLTFWPWLLTYFWKKLNLGHNFWTKRDRAFIFHMCISCDKTFLLIPIYLT